MSSALKIVLIILVTTVVAGGGAYYYEANKSTSDKNTLQATIDDLTTKLAATDQGISAPATNWKTYTSSVVNLAFKYPPAANYSETEPLLARVKDGLKVTGHQPSFTDKNKVFPDFDATTTDFTAVDTTPEDLITGTLDSTSSFSVAAIDKSTMITTQVAPGMFHVTGFTSLECSPGTTSYLFVRPPKGSELKYIEFFLGGGADFSNNDFQPSDPCTPLPAALAQNLQALDNSPQVIATMDKAISIARTFTTK